MEIDDFLSDTSNETDELEETLPATNPDGQTIIQEIPGEIESANCRVFSTRELYEKMNNDRIDVEPPYQRDVVWPKAAQSALIDSIFKNKWVPTLLFSLRPAHLDNYGKTVKEKWVCMDGKQRLTSIKLFMDGKIPWIEKPGKHWYYRQSNPPNPSRLILSDERNEIWLSRGLTTAMYSKLTEFQERDIFRLVQEGKPLTIGEKMQAAAGEWGEYFDEMTQKYMAHSDKNPTGWCTRVAHLKRGADFKTMTAMILLIHEKSSRSPEPPRFLSSLTLQKELDSLMDSKVPDRLKAEVKQLLDSFMKITMLAPPKTRWMVEPHTPDALFQPIVKGRKSMLSPVELIWIPYLIAMHGPKVSLGRLLEMIQMLKIDIRKNYPREVKNNQQVTNYIINWIQKFDLTRLTGCYKNYEVPKPPPEEKDETNLNKPTFVTSKMDSEAPTGSGKRKSFPSPAENNSNNSTSSTNSANATPSKFKRPRCAGPTPIPASQSNASPRSTPSQQNSIPNSRPANAQQHSVLSPRINGTQQTPLLNPRPSITSETSKPVINSSSKTFPSALSSSPAGSLQPSSASSTFESQAAQAAERAKAVAANSLSQRAASMISTASKQNRNGFNSSNSAADSQMQNSPVTPCFVSNYSSSMRPSGFQLPQNSKAGALNSFSSQSQNIRALGSSMASKVRYNQFASGDFGKPTPASLPPRPQGSISALGSQSNELFRLESPNPYAAHKGPAWRTE